MKNHQRILLFTAGAALGLVLARRNHAVPAIPHRRLWQKLLAKEKGEVPAAVFLGRVQERFQKLYMSRPIFEHPALKNHLENRILPGLASFQVWLEELGDPRKAIEQTGALLDETARLGYAPLRPITAKTWFFPVFRRVLRLIMAQNYPSQGWKMEWVVDDDQAISFEIHSCFYHQVLTAYGVPELTSAFCHSDDAAMQGILGLLFERRGTIGRGDPMCDFCYRRTT